MECAVIGLEGAHAGPGAKCSIKPGYRRSRAGSIGERSQFARRAPRSDQNHAHIPSAAHHLPPRASRSRDPRN